MGTDIAAENPLDVDNYHFFTADNPKYGAWDIVGISQGVKFSGWSYSGSVCIPIKRYRVGITEFFGNPNDWEGGKLNAALVNMDHYQINLSNIRYTY